MSIIRPAIDQPIPAQAQKVFSGVIFDVYQWQQEMYDGSFETFEKLKRVDTVAVLPVTLEGKIIVTYEEQPGKGRFVNLPGGRMEPGETVEKAALRELEEETGFVSDDLSLWFCRQPATKIDYVVYFLIAKNCRPIGQKHLDSGEKIQVREVNFEEFCQIVLDPNFADIEIKLELLLAEKEGRLGELKEKWGVA